MSFPTYLLDECSTGLVLFSSAFSGSQDAAFLLEHGVVGTCVDRDPVALNKMKASYPKDWRFHRRDAYDFVLGTNRIWDIVTADPWTNQMEECAGQLSTFCQHANRAVVLGCKELATFKVPEGWRETDRIRRSDFAGGVYWVVFENNSLVREDNASL